ncbi:MAG: hypothetical protein Q8P97_01635 [bacterium]|nr:hypothetical protein [bacterium]
MFDFVRDFFRFKEFQYDESEGKFVQVQKKDYGVEEVKKKDYKVIVEELTTFPGFLEEFNQLTGCEHVILDTGKIDKEVAFRTKRLTKGGEVDQDLILNLVERGCVGFIHVRESERTERYATLGPRGGGGIVTRDYYVWRGVPVAKKGNILE